MHLQIPFPTSTTPTPPGTGPAGTVPAEPSLLETLTNLEDACGRSPSWVCERVYDWTGNAWLAGAAEWFVAKPVTILLVVLVTWLVARLLRGAVRRGIRRAVEGKRSGLLGKVTPSALRSDAGRSMRADARAQALSTVFSSIVTAFVWFVAIVVILSILEIDLAPLLASAGIVGFALGFGAQDVVKDFLAGMFIILEDQFGVGDVVDLGEASGTVEAITLRTTRVRDLDGVVWHVPNGEIQRVANKSQEWAQALLDVDVAYDTDLDEAIAVIQRVADELAADDEWVGEILDAPEVWGVETFGADGVTIRMVMKVRPAAQWRVLRELRLRLKRTFDAEGIEIPFPQRTVWVKEAEGVSPATDPQEGPG